LTEICDQSSADAVVVFLLERGPVQREVRIDWK